MINKFLSRLVALFLFTGSLLFMVGAAQGDFITLDAADSGRYNQIMFKGTATSHEAADSSYVATLQGTFGSRNYFVFDLAEITGTVTSARLVLDNPRTVVGPATYSLWDVSTPIPDLVVDQSGPSGSVAAQIYTDLGSGVPYSSLQVVSGDDRLVTIPLNDAALQSITAAQGQQFAVGGALSGTVPPGTSIFLDTGGASVRQLVLEVSPVEVTPVPGPSALTLLGLGALGLFGYGRRRRKQTA